MNHKMYDSAFIVVGLQLDFLIVGNAEFPGLNYISGKIEKLAPMWNHLIVLNEEHPADHISFAACHPWRKPHQILNIGDRNQYLWPIHCVSGTLGALNPNWLISLNPLVIKNGMERETENYSAFDNLTFREYLTNHHIKHLFFSGFPLEYQLRENMLDALNKGFEVSLIQDCTLSLSLNNQDTIYKELLHLGVKKISYSDLIQT